jgi:HPt (histidine-containing phosphotransfer) domain-containing protein
LRSILIADRSCRSSISQEFAWPEERPGNVSINVAANAKNLSQLSAVSHKLKGAEQAVGADVIGRTAAALEQAGKAGNWTSCRDLLEPLAAQLRLALTEIDKRLDHANQIGE